MSGDKSESRRLAVICKGCMQFIPLNITIPPNVELRAEDPEKTLFEVACPHCSHRAKYPFDQVFELKAP